MFLYHFNVLILKIIFFKKNIYYFNVFLSEKYFEKQQNYIFKQFKRSEMKVK